jgi:hypothetical protein
MKTCNVGDGVSVNCTDGFGGTATVVDVRNSPGSRYKVQMNDKNPHEPFWAHDFEIEGLEPVMTRDDVIRSTAAHIRRVGELMVGCSGKLCQRAVAHDKSKWHEHEWRDFEKATPQLAELTYGSDEYKAALKSIQPALKHHYANNSHHPEHHPDGVDGMTLLDLVEMLCDWKAATERHNDGSIAKSLDHNRERFKIGPQLEAILRNTARAEGWIT